LGIRIARRFSCYTDSQKSNTIIISQKISRKLSLGVQDEALFYFQGKKSHQPFVRKFTVAGIYETGIELFDDLYVFADICEK
jgi:lipoprotein-releasing system permease protein